MSFLMTQLGPSYLDEVFDNFFLLNITNNLFKYCMRSIIFNILHFAFTATKKIMRHVCVYYNNFVITVNISSLNLEFTILFLRTSYLANFIR